MLPLGITFIEWVQSYGAEHHLPIKKRPNALLEKALCRYFISNTNKILEIQQDYMERGQGIDLVTATKYAIIEDIQNPYQHISELNPLESAIQVVMAMEKASSEGGPFDETRIAKIMNAASKEFRMQENYRKSMGLYMVVAQCYSKTLLHCFQKLADKAA